MKIIHKPTQTTLLLKSYGQRTMFELLVIHLKLQVLVMHLMCIVNVRHQKGY